MLLLSIQKRLGFSRSRRSGERQDGGLLRSAGLTHRRDRFLRVLLRGLPRRSIGGSPSSRTRITAPASEHDLPGLGRWVGRIGGSRQPAASAMRRAEHRLAHPDGSNRLKSSAGPRPGRGGATLVLDKFRRHGPLGQGAERQVGNDSCARHVPAGRRQRSPPVGASEGRARSAIAGRTTYGVCSEGARKHALEAGDRPAEELLGGTPKHHALRSPRYEPLREQSG